MTRIAEWQHIADWQLRYREQPKVYLVEDSDGLLEGVYATAEAAQFSVNWHRKRGQRLRVRSEPIRSIELSRERWGEGT